MSNREIGARTVRRAGQRPHAMPFGAEVQPGGEVRFRLWAPACDVVLLHLEGVDHPLPLTALPEGWHERVTPLAKAGSRYRFELPDGRRVPDPASRAQPEDVHGPSEVIDPGAHLWTDDGWEPRPWAESVIYELHTGTFTPEGTFEAAIGKLDHLAALGVTTIELMPIADFPGRRNWGYDGVFLYAPDASYGTPDDLRRLVDAAHARGLAVLLDVVYNHFGPDGNYLPAYAPQFFTATHKTPWGDAVNYDAPGSAVVREFVIQNALYWLDEFHIDGLRLDAVHTIIDTSDTSVVVELAERVRGLDRGRHVRIILENEDNEAGHLERQDGRPRRYTAQWNDDVHHVLHTAATGEAHAYYADYVGDTAKLGRALAEGFAFQGEMMPFRGSPRGEPSAGLPPAAFIGFLQNHDQIGNRAFGDRIGATAAPAALRAVTATMLLLPQIPMLFMGEEWGTSRPFPFFSDFEGELGEAVRKGRREEFKHDPALGPGRPEIPDPQAEATFQSAKLDWAALDEPAHRATFDWYTGLLRRRKAHVVPLIPHFHRGGAFVERGLHAVSVTWEAKNGSRLRLDANLKSAPQEGFGPSEGDIVWQEGQVEGSTFGPWSIRWTLHDHR